MSATNAFFIWFFTGLSGLGGWLIFLLLAFAAVIWIIYDSSKRNLPVLGWRLGASLLALLLLPALIYRFSSAETRLSLDPFIEAIFYLGLLGGILPVVLAIGYYVTYKGLVGCKNGHIYEAVLGQCPECAPARQDFIAGPFVDGGVHDRIDYQKVGRTAKPKANAWLVDQTGRSYQLCQGETSIGRSATNDVQFSGIISVSRMHAKIQERNGRFYLTDLASSSGTKVNGKFIHQMTLLEPNDEIRFSDQVIVTFVTTNR
ncbi:MAG: FHA domain-containing protein [Anaerolineaceae bacterium]